MFSRLSAPSICFCAFVGLIPLSFGQNPYGRFLGPLNAQFDLNGTDIKLLDPLVYVDAAGQQWVAPAGTVSDGASIPRVVWSIIGAPLTGKFRYAAVIHDVACVEKKRPWENVHVTFYNAMMASGTDSIQAKAMYAAVYHCGPRWNLDGHGIPPQLCKATYIESLRNYITNRENGKLFETRFEADLRNEKEWRATAREYTDTEKILQERRIKSLKDQIKEAKEKTANLSEKERKKQQPIIDQMEAQLSQLELRALVKPGPSEIKPLPPISLREIEQLAPDKFPG